MLRFFLLRHRSRGTINQEFRFGPAPTLRSSHSNQSPRRGNVPHWLGDRHLGQVVGGERWLGHQRQLLAGILLHFREDGIEDDLFTLVQTLAKALANRSRVGKGRPAGSIELQVSPSLSKIPYGGFSPVRLQMDRQERPSTTSRGLSAVHIRPRTPPYTPPQSQLPGIRDPRRDYPFENLSVQCGTTPSNSNRPSRGPWLAIGFCCPDGSSLTTASSEPLNPSPPLRNSRRRLLHPRKIGLRWEFRGSPIDSAGLDSRAASLTPVAPKSADDCCFLFGLSLHLPVPGSAITLVVSRLQSSLRVDFALMLRPASWLALLARTFTFELAPTQVTLDQRRI